MVAIFIITIHIEIVIFPYFEKKKQIGFERTINSSLSHTFPAGFWAQVRPTRSGPQKGKDFQKLKICDRRTLPALTNSKKPERRS